MKRGSFLLSGLTVGAIATLPAVVLSTPDPNAWAPKNLRFYVADDDFRYYPDFGYWAGTDWDRIVGAKVRNGEQIHVNRVYEMHVRMNDDHKFHIMYHRKEGWYWDKVEAELSAGKTISVELLVISQEILPNNKVNVPEIDVRETWIMTPKDTGRMPYMHIDQRMSLERVSILWQKIRTTRV